MKKEAFSPQSEDFLRWCFLRWKELNESDVQRILGKYGVPLIEKGPSRSGPLTEGELVRVDKDANTNEQNVDECNLYHGLVGKVVAVTSKGISLQFDGGQIAFFDGLKAGKSTGLYRHTPMGAGVSEEARGRVFEILYLKDPNAKKPNPANVKHRMDEIQKYVDAGSGKGENRSVNYYTGSVANMAISKEGNLYFLMHPVQRNEPTAISPKKGTVLYLGMVGQRPGGWESDLAEMSIGLDTEEGT
jgi:hypothetical protein